MDNRNFIAKRAAAYFRPGDVVNLGIGIPSLCGSYAVDGVLFQSENGFIGIGPTVQEGLMKTSASSMRAECLRPRAGEQRLRCGHVLQRHPLRTSRRHGAGRTPGVGTGGSG